VRGLDGAADAASVQTSSDLRVTIGRLARRIKQLYEEGEVTFSETSVLSRLNREGPTTPSALAGAEHVRPQAIVTTLNSLEGRGLVERSPDPSDGRRVVVSLTGLGQQVLTDKGWSVTQGFAAALETRFSPAERSLLREALPLLDRLADLV
jgi:DNA-binding MarR family transcriptional regulator